MVTKIRANGIRLRVDNRRRGLIERAAEAIGVSQPEFILDAATREATAVLLDRCLFLLDPAAFRQPQATLMLRSYDDIHSRITDPVQWWDDNGVPRYCEFRPDACGVYDQAVALVEVACQMCQQRFAVAMARDDGAVRGNDYKRPSNGDLGSFRYGDPPSHGTPGCVGNSMTVESVRVLEFWEREKFNWIRRPEHEVYIGEHEREDDVSDLL